MLHGILPISRVTQSLSHLGLNSEDMFHPAANLGTGVVTLAFPPRKRTVSVSLALNVFSITSFF